MWKIENVLGILMRIYVKANDRSKRFEVKTSKTTTTTPDLIPNPQCSCNKRNAKKQTLENPSQQLLGLHKRFLENVAWIIAAWLDLTFSLVHFL